MVVIIDNRKCTFRTKYRPSFVSFRISSYQQKCFVISISLSSPLSLMEPTSFCGAPTHGLAATIMEYSGLIRWSAHHSKISNVACWKIGSCLGTKLGILYDSHCSFNFCNITEEWIDLEDNQNTQFTFNWVGGSHSLAIESFHCIVPAALMIILELYFYWLNWSKSANPSSSSLVINSSWGMQQFFGSHN